MTNAVTASPRATPAPQIQEEKPIAWDREVAKLEALQGRIARSEVSPADLVAMRPELEKLQTAAAAANQYSVLEILGLILASLTGVGALIVAGGLIADAVTENDHEKAEALVKATLLAKKTKLPPEKAKLG